MLGFLGRFWIWLLIFAPLLRVGEAQNPGPQDECLALGTVNPSGINGKVCSFLDLPPGLWSIAETQATQPVFQRFSRELRAFQGSSRNLCLRHGACAPLRANSNSAGAWTGVAQMADCHIRPIHVPWRGHEWNSGRLMLSSFHLDSHCLVGATVYAPPRGPTYANAHALTQELLLTLSQELIHGMTGPRFISGDFNVNPDELPVFDEWRAAGWHEIQEWALMTQGRDKVPTCKGVTFRDHVWVSPEMLPWLHSVECHLDCFADHAVLLASLRVPVQTAWQHVWAQPSPLPWDGVDLGSFVSGSSSAHVWNCADLSGCFANWSLTAESELIQQLSSVKNVPASSRGRGQTTKVTRKACTHVPIAPARHGDRVPRSQVLSRAVHSWFKQVRRFQAYVQRAQTGLSTPTIQHDQRNTWSAIRRAHGFGGFLSWWPKREIQLHGSPAQFPRWPPSLELAKILLTDMDANYRAFEAWNLRQRLGVIRAKHAEHNKILYAQLRGSSAASLACLRRSHVALVSDVTSVDVVELESSLPSWADSSCQWTLQGLPADVAPLSESQVRVSCDLLLAVGQTLKVQKFLTQFQDLELELHGLWDPIWNRHAGVAQSQWDRALAFGRAHLPAGSCSSPPWSATQFRQVIKTYKRKTTRGPDAWDRNDLLALSDDRLTDLCHLFQHLESGHPWPTQLTTGFVCPIPKVEQAEVATQFRPIVLISLLYRLWASASSKTFLPFLSSRISPHVFGYVHGRRAMDIWCLVQIAIEVAHVTSQAVSGYCADLVKCFNRLPRRPLFGLLGHLGLSTKTLVAWENALGGLARRFRIRQDVGPARLSVTGFPEGDPLSCVAMLCFNCVFDAYIKVFAPETIPFAYVDNIQLISSTAAMLQPGILVMQTFMDAWDLSLDPDKSYAWSSATTQRTHLRGFGHMVRLSGRDLGAQMTYSKVTRKTVFHQRLDSVAHMWTLLRRSSAPTWFRKLALRMALLPKLLHGCENAWIPRSTLDKLRSRCMFALGWDRAGANPLVRWALMQPTGSDPEFYQLWQVLTCFWRLSRLFPMVRAAWGMTRQADELAPGPLQSMDAALDLLGWCLDADWMLHMDDFVCSWWLLNLDTLKILARHFWQQSLCSRWNRKDFSGLSSIDVEVSFSFRTPNLATNELLSTIQDGSFYTSNILAKFDVTKPAKCAWCGVEDDLQHRALHCPRYASVRDEHPDVSGRWPHMTRAFNEHGLVQANPHLWQHWQALMSLPDTTEVFYFEVDRGGPFHLFSDGSCTDGESCIKRLAAWGVIEMSSNRVVARGVIPGLLQTIDVAELTGAVSALRWTLKCHAQVVLHVDSQYVHDGLLALLERGFVPHHWRSQTLWHQALDILRQLDAGQFQVHKVFSHYDEAAAPTCVDEWMIRGNDKADAVASRAHELRPLSFHHNHRSLCQHHDRMTELVHSQLKFLLALAQQDLAEPSRHHNFDIEDLPLGALVQNTEPNDCALAAQFELETINLLPDRCAAGFSRRFSSEILTLLLDCDTTAAHARHVTGVEFLAAYLTLYQGHIPVPRIVNGCQIYEDQDAVVVGGLIRHTIASAIQILRKCLGSIFAQFGILPHLGRANRPDLGLFMSVWSIRVGWPDHVESASRVLVHQWFASRCVRRTCDLARPLN